MSQRSLVELSPDDCLSRLSQERVGRVVYSDAVGPVAIPVNFAIAGRDVVFRMEPGNTALASVQGMVAFEADHIDETNQSGWSVVVRGHLAAVGLDQIPSLLQDMAAGPPLPWAGGVHNVWLRIRPEMITGRSLGTPAVPLVI